MRTPSLPLFKGKWPVGDEHASQETHSAPMRMRGGVSPSPCSSPCLVNPLGGVEELVFAERLYIQRAQSQAQKRSCSLLNYLPPHLPPPPHLSDHSRRACALRRHRHANVHASRRSQRRTTLASPAADQAEDKRACALRAMIREHHRLKPSFGVFFFLPPYSAPPPDRAPQPRATPRSHPAPQQTLPKAVRQVL